jgi:hypothetical protein
MAGYKRPMRRTLRLGLILFLGPAVAFGLYAAYWHTVAERLQDGFNAWVRQARADKLDVSWRELRLTGFPIAFRIALKGAAFRYAALSPAPVLRIPVLRGSARPWDPGDWRLAARRGLVAGIAGTAGRAPIVLSARSATGAISVRPAGDTRIWLTLEEATAEGGARVAVGRADSWVVLPPHARAEPFFGLALRLRRVRLPVAVAPLGDTIADLSAGLTVKGPLPPGPLAKAVAAWRDAGGVVELDHFRLHWGVLGATGAGTLALDRNLQPVGGFAGAIEGYDEILTALVKSGRLRAAQAGLARLALTMLAKAGPDGRPQIATSFTIENGQMYLGPAKLGPAPRIAWE